MNPALPFPLVQSFYPHCLFKFCISEIQGPEGLRTVLGLKGRHNCVGKVGDQGSCAVDPVLPGFMEPRLPAHRVPCHSPCSVTAPALRQQLNGGLIIYRKDGCPWNKNSRVDGRTKEQPRETKDGFVVSGYGLLALSRSAQHMLGPFSCRHELRGQRGPFILGPLPQKGKGQVVHSGRKKLGEEGGQ